jgi:hypothetical protein
MGRIERMERGTVCRLTGRPQYNHQTWRGGRNVTRYVPPDEARLLRQAIEGYTLFRRLAEQYADAIIRRTRAQRAQASARNRATPRQPQPRQKKPPAQKLDA